MRSAPGGRGTFQFQIFIQTPSPEIWSETISGGEEVLAGKWGGLFLSYLLGKNFRRRDRDHLISPRRMDAVVCRAERICWCTRRRSLLGPSPRNQIADGMNAAGRSAKRLFDDAQLLADAARFSVMPF